jgi:hypothetical protein
MADDQPSHLRDNSSVRDLLAVLSRNDGVRVIHRDVATADDLVQYLKRWRETRYRGFRIGYLALHGYPGRVVFRRAKVPIAEIAAKAKGSADGKIVFFGSCSGAADRRRLETFKQLTGARAVCGYTKEADWTPSAAFDLMLLHSLAWYESLPRAERWVRQHAKGLCDHVGFITL